MNRNPAFLFVGAGFGVGLDERDRFAAGVVVLYDRFERIDHFPQGVSFAGTRSLNIRQVHAPRDDRATAVLLGDEHATIKNRHGPAAGNR